LCGPITAALVRWLGLAPPSQRRTDAVVVGAIVERLSRIAP
jgi:hypothetical protein